MPFRRYFITYAPTERDADHESWLWEWALEWFDGDSELLLVVQRTEGSCLRRIWITIDASGDGHRDSPNTSTLFTRLADHAEYLRIQRCPPDHTPRLN